MKHIPRIYIDQKLCAKKSIILDKTPSHHLINVLRLKPNSPVIIFNGEGGEYSGKITNADKKTAEVILETFHNVQNESPVYIELWQGIARNERMDLIMQKAVELGVNAISPIWTEYSNIKIDKNKMEKRLTHWQKIIVSAAEQSGRCVIPQLNPPLKLSDKLTDSNDFDMKWVCHPPDPSSHSLSPSLQNQPSSLRAERSNLCGLPRELKFPRNDVGRVCILIGPEGGLSEKEVSAAKANGFKVLTLGPRILRTETAAIATIAIIQSTLGDYTLNER